MRQLITDKDAAAIYRATTRPKGESPVHLAERDTTTIHLTEWHATKGIPDYAERWNLK